MPRPPLGQSSAKSFTVEEILVEDGRVTGIRGHAAGGETVTERARVVIGADGKNSLVAKTVQAEQYNEAPPLAPSYYTYWSDLRPTASRPTSVPRTIAAGAACRRTTASPAWSWVAAGAVRGQPRRRRGHVHEDLRSCARVRRANPGCQAGDGFKGSRDLPGYFRKPYGPGWTLVGDAGYHKHPITAYGITDAFRDAEAVASALDDTFAERQTFDDTMAAFQRARDEKAGPIYGLTCDFAKIEPPPPEMLQLFGAIYGNSEAQDDFVSVMAGTLPVPEFFAPENVGRIMAAGGRPGS